jgi:hypothetical protein
MSLNSTITGEQADILLTSLPPVSHAKKTVSPAVMAATKAEYDPTWYDRQKGNGRGTPKDWHFCECGSEKCPDKGKMDGTALAPWLNRPSRSAVNDAA